MYNPELKKCEEIKKKEEKRRLRVGGAGAGVPTAAPAPTCAGAQSWRAEAVRPQEQGDRVFQALHRY